MYFVWRVGRYIPSLSEVHVYLQGRYVKNIWTNTGSFLQMTISFLSFVVLCQISPGYSLFAAHYFTELLLKNL